MSYAIAIFPDEAVSDWVAVNRRGLATNFPVHVTIKTRFDVAVDVSVEQLEEVVSGVFPCEPFRAVLDGPFYIENRIRWIECRPGNEGFDRIIGLHRACWVRSPSRTVHPSPAALARSRGTTTGRT